MNKQELTQRILASRSQLEMLLSKFSDERMELTILHGEWSVKDLLGHLAFWENRVVMLFAELHAGKSPEPFGDIDALNAQAIEEYRAMSLKDLREFENTAFQAILNLISDANDTELFDPTHFSWTEGRRFEEIISDNTWGHYEEHFPELNSWLKRIA